jgi:hypothetical protein
MSQSDGEPACQGKTYNALKDKKHLTRINKEEVLALFGRGLIHNGSLRKLKAFEKVLGDS